MALTTEVECYMGERLIGSGSAKAEGRYIEVTRGGLYGGPADFSRKYIVERVWQVEITCSPADFARLDLCKDVITLRRDDFSVSSNLYASSRTETGAMIVFTDFPHDQK